MMNVFDDREFARICEKLGISGFIKDIVIKYEKSSFFEKVRSHLQRDRRGEVVFCVVRPGGKVITVTCSEYPAGIYRIPTGGIGHREDILEAVFREVKEELGLETEIIGFPGVLRIRFEYKDQFLMFYSYLFILREKSGSLLEDATDDEISGIKEAGLAELMGITAALDLIQGSWSDWGKFRYASTGAVLDYLTENAEELGIKA